MRQVEAEKAALAEDHLKLQSQLRASKTAIEQANDRAERAVAEAQQQIRLAKAAIEQANERADRAITDATQQRRESDRVRAAFEGMCEPCVCLFVLPFRVSGRSFYSCFV